eukprot:scaffold5126_cov125-Isochrysis_galbana.AAC.5
MGKEWGRGGGVSGRPKDRGVPPCRRYYSIADSCSRRYALCAAHAYTHANMLRYAMHLCTSYDLNG